MGPRIIAAFALLVATACAASAAPPPSDIGAMDYFRGTWDCAGTFTSTGRAIESVIRFDSDLHGNALVKHHDDKSPAPYHAIEVWVAQPDQHGYAAAVADIFGGVREFHTAGWNGDTLVWQSGIGTQPIQRFVYRRIDRRAFGLDWDISKDGTSYTVGDTLTCKRHGS